MSMSLGSWNRRMAGQAEPAAMHIDGPGLENGTGDGDAEMTDACSVAATAAAVADRSHGLPMNAPSTHFTASVSRALFSSPSPDASTAAAAAPSMGVAAMSLSAAPVVAAASAAQPKTAVASGADARMKGEADKTGKRAIKIEDTDRDAKRAKTGAQSAAAAGPAQRNDGAMDILQAASDERMGDATLSFEQRILGMVSSVVGFKVDTSALRGVPLSSLEAIATAAGVTRDARVQKFIDDEYKAAVGSIDTHFPCM